MRNDTNLRFWKNFSNVEINWISILFNELIWIILYWTSIMHNNKLFTSFSSLLEVLIWRQIVLIFRSKCFVSSVCHTNFIKNREKRKSFGSSNQINTCLVIFIGNALPWDLFFFVLRLLHGKHVIVELPLKFFVSEINTELFERI